MGISTGQMSFINDVEIDTKATVRASSNFLDKGLNKGFERYLRRAGWNRNKLAVIDESHISSPKMDASGVSAHGGINNMENNFVSIIDAKQVCLAVYKAITSCQNSSKKPYRKILELSYLDYHDYTLDVIGSVVGYSERQTANLKRQALCEFADLFETYKIEYGLTDPDRKDLKLLILKKQNCI